MTYRPTPSGTGVDKIVSGVEQTPASLVVNADVDNAANIAGSKLQAASAANAGSLAAADYNRIPASGDVSVVARASTVVGMNGQAVTAGTAPGQLLQYNGVSWALKSGFGGTSSQLAAADGSDVNVGANLSLVGGVLSATGGAAGPWVSTGITGTANALPIFDPTGIASLLSEPGDKTNKVLGWAGGVLAWVVVASAVVIPSNQPYERDLVIANVDYENTDVGSSVTVFAGTVV